MAGIILRVLVLSACVLMVTSIGNNDDYEFNLKFYTQKWFSYHLQRMLHKGNEVSYTGMVLKFMSRTDRILQFCFKARFRETCGGDNFGLCGGLYLEVDKAYNCTWKIKVPKRLCTKITVVDIPSSDPLGHQDYNLGIYFQDEDNQINNALNFKQKFENLYVISNTSIVKVNFEISHIFGTPKFQLTF